MKIGKISMLIGLVLCVLKMAGLAFAEVSWWLIAAPLYGPIALFILFMVASWFVVGARYGSDEVMENVLNDEEVDDETREKIKKLYQKYCQ